MSKELYFAGIDPGKLGATAIIRVVGKRLYSEAFITETVMVEGPRRKSKKTKAKKRREYVLGHILKTAAMLSQYKARVVIEDQWPRPFDSRVAARELGVGFGYWLMALHEYAVEPIKVPPATWKAGYCRPGKGKQESIDVCNGLFDLEFDEKQDGLAEALLLADYSRRTFFNISLPRKE